MKVSWWNDNVCFFCLKPIGAKGKNRASKDHIIPRSRGGSFGFSLWMPTCKSCNHSRGHMELWEFLLKLNQPTRAFEAWDAMI